MHWFLKRKTLFCLFFALSAIVFLGSAKTEQIQREAEAAMIHRDYREARDAYRKLLDAGVYGNAVVQCARAERELSNHAEAKLLLDGFDFTSLAPAQRREAVILLGYIYNDCGEIERALSLLKRLDKKIPRGNWRREERAFYGALLIAVDEKYDQLISKGEEAIEACSFEEAIPFYEKTLAAAQEGVYPARGAEDRATFEARLRYRIGEAHYHLEQYDEAYAILSPIRHGALKSEGLSPYHNEVTGHCLHLLGLSQKRSGDHLQALATFITYLDTVVGRSAERAMVEWEAALCYLQLGEPEQARQLFSRITGGSNALAHLAQVYLSKIDLDSSDFASVEERLRLLAQSLHQDDPLRYEVSYLRGEGALQRGDFQDAIHRFEQAIPRHHPEQAHWHNETLHGLGTAYLGFAQKLKHDKAAQLMVFARATDTFSQLADDRGAIGRARVELARHNKSTTKAVFDLLKPVEQFESPGIQAQALLILGEAAPSYADREHFYAALTDEKYSNTPSFATGWLQRGINYFSQGEAYRKLGDPSPTHFKAAAEALAKAFELLPAGGEAAEALKCRAHALFQMGDGLEGYSLLSSLLTLHRPIFNQIEHKDEVFYLLGLMGAVIGEEAESYLDHVLSEYPDSPHAAPALNALATLYFQQSKYREAEKLFSQLALDHPHSQLAGNGWFWAAESAERLHHSASIVRDYRKKVFDHYPNSEFAARAYFEYCSFAEYLQGDEGAMKHLEQMATRYPDSPYLVTAHYLRGLNCRASLTDAIKAFRAASDTFDRTYSCGLIPIGSLDYFTSVRYRTLVELALANLEKGKVEQGAERHVSLRRAEEIFSSLLNDFNNQDHLLARLVSQGNPYPRVAEEAQFGLAQTYLAAHKYDDAEATLSQMLSEYERLQRTVGYYPSRVWYHQGHLCMERGAIETAIECLRHAEEAGVEGVLSANQRLDLLLQQSTCLQRLGQLDDAMLLLSRIINDEAASPLRIEAMYRRSEIYTLQGRHDLARKQLEATAAKTGLWAAKAETQLREMYDF